MDHLGHDLKTVLVTGASGYLGGRVLALLQEEGTPVVGVARNASRGLTPCDLTKPDAVELMMRRTDPSTVVHCAASVPRNAADYADSEAAHRSCQMLENVLRCKPPHVVFASSMTVYPDSIEVAHEEDASLHGDGYAAGKLHAEELLLAAPRTAATILRLPGLFGPPRQAGVLFNAALAFARGKALQLDADLPRWSAIHVDDAAKFLVRAARSHANKPRVVNAGYPGSMAVGDAVRRIAAQFGIDFQCRVSKWFTFDLTRFEHEFGPPCDNLDRRLRELAELARVIAAKQVAS